MKATAAVTTRASGPFVSRTVELEQLRVDEVRVRIEATGICHADLVARDQMLPVPLPAVLGHEGAGIVEEVGSSVATLTPGDRVVLGFNSCGHCSMCHRGYPGSCEQVMAYNWDGYRPDGTSPVSLDGEPISGWYFGQSSFSSMINVPARIAVKVDTDLPAAVLGPLGCGVTTGAGTVMNVLRPEPASSFAVFGTGAVGFAALLTARLMGATTLVAVDPVAAKRELALRLGATHVVDSATTDPVEALRDITGGRGVDYAVDAVGVPAVFTQMAEALARRGHGALVGVPAPGRTADLEVGTLLNRTSPRLSLVIEGDAVPHDIIPRLVRLCEAGLLPLQELVTQYPIADINTAVADMEAGRVVKPVVVPGATSGNPAR